MKKSLKQARNKIIKVLLKEKCVKVVEIFRPFLKNRKR